MPFGLCNAPATFQRVMQIVLAGLEGEGVFVYLDDILIASKNFGEHLRQLRAVFERLRSAGLRLKPKKCLFLRDEVLYLGHVISVKGVKPDSAKTEKVKCFPIPRDVTCVRQFIGLASYYRRFVNSFASIASPLRALTKKNAKFSWTSECQVAFDKLKELLVSAPVLAYPRFGLGIEFILETDASGIGLGAILSQTQDDGELHPIAYASCSLDNSERNYGITELETLAVVWAARHFRPYLLGHHTIVFTDHSACVSVLRTARPSGKIARWALTVQELNLTLKHRAGKLNSNADALSRNPITEPDHDTRCDGSRVCNSGGDRCDDGVEGCSSGDSICRGCGVYNGCGCDTGGCIESSECGAGHDDCCKCGVIASGSSDSQGCCCCGRRGCVDDELFCGEYVLEVGVNENGDVVNHEDDLKLCESNKEIHQMQMEDVDLQPYKKYHSHGLLPEDQNVARKIVLESQHYEMIDGVLHHENPNQPGRWCIVVPKKLHSQLLNEAHAGCFGGHLSEKVYDKLQRSYWWYGLRRDVRRFCRSCLNCVHQTRARPFASTSFSPYPCKGTVSSSSCGCSTVTSHF